MFSYGIFQPYSFSYNPSGVKQTWEQIGNECKHIIQSTTWAFFHILYI